MDRRFLNLSLHYAFFFSSFYKVKSRAKRWLLVSVAHNTPHNKMEVCRETMIMSPLAVDFETLCIQDDDNNTNTSSNIALFALPEKQRSLSWENRRSTSSSSLDSSLPGNPATPTSQQPLFKVGSGEFNVRKTKKSRPSLLGEKHAGLVVEQLITKQFVEEEAELATLSLDFANKVAAQKDEEVSPRVRNFLPTCFLNKFILLIILLFILPLFQCPAPDPSSMMMLSRPKKALQDKKHRRASLDVTTYPFGLRPRMKRKRG